MDHCKKCGQDHAP